MKKTHRLLRDVSFVVVFCLGFLGLIKLANFLQDDSDKQTSSEFSEYRLEADKAARGHNLDGSLENLRALVKNDPFDGRAQHELASTLFSRLVEAQDSLAELRRTGSLEKKDTQKIPLVQTESWERSSQLRPLDLSTSSSEAPANSQAGDERDADLNDQIRVLLDQAIQEYKLAENHSRYRLRSQIQLAVLLATKGDHEAAFDSLEKFVDAGGATRRGLDQIQQFVPIMDGSGTAGLLQYKERFLDIVERELENRTGSMNFRGHRRRPVHSIWSSLERLNKNLVAYRIKLVNFIRKLFE